MDRLTSSDTRNPLLSPALCLLSVCSGIWTPLFGDTVEGVPLETARTDNFYCATYCNSCCVHRGRTCSAPVICLPYTAVYDRSAIYGQPQYSRPFRLEKRARSEIAGIHRYVVLGSRRGSLRCMGPGRYCRLGDRQHHGWWLGHVGERYGPSVFRYRISRKRAIRPYKRRGARRDQLRKILVLIVTLPFAATAPGSATVGDVPDPRSW